METGDGPEEGEKQKTKTKQTDYPFRRIRASMGVLWLSMLSKKPCNQRK